MEGVLLLPLKETLVGSEMKTPFPIIKICPVLNIWIKNTF